MICSIVFTCGILAPRVPAYVVVLMVLLAVYAGVSYYMYKAHPAPERSRAAGAQNQLSGELSDSVANILAVKTYGREDYERGAVRRCEPRGGGARFQAHVGVARARHHDGVHRGGHHGGW